MELWVSHSRLNFLGGYPCVGIFLSCPHVPEGPVPLQGQLWAGFPSIRLPSSSFIVKLQKKMWACVRNGERGMWWLKIACLENTRRRCFRIPAYPACQQGWQNTGHWERNNLEKSKPQAVRAGHPTCWDRRPTPHPFVQDSQTGACMSSGMKQQRDHYSPGPWSIDST